MSPLTKYLPALPSPLTNLSTVELVSFIALYKTLLPDNAPTPLNTTTLSTYLNSLRDRQVSLIDDKSHPEETIEDAGNELFFADLDVEEAEARYTRTVRAARKNNSEKLQAKLKDAEDHVNEAHMWFEQLNEQKQEAEAEVTMYDGRFEALSEQAIVYERLLALFEENERREIEAVKEATELAAIDAMMIDSYNSGAFPAASMVADNVGFAIDANHPMGGDENSGALPTAFHDASNAGSTIDINYAIAGNNNINDGALPPPSTPASNVGFAASTNTNHPTATDNTTETVLPNPSFDLPYRPKPATTTTKSKKANSSPLTKPANSRITKPVFKCKLNVPKRSKSPAVDAQNFQFHPLAAQAMMKGVSEVLDADAVGEDGNANGNGNGNGVQGGYVPPGMGLGGGVDGMGLSFDSFVGVFGWC